MDYKEEIIDHYKNPRNFGEMVDPDRSLVEANTSCGDMIKIFLKMDGGKITDISWQGVGCAISTAAASMLSEKVVGMEEQDIIELGEKGIVKMLGGEINAGRIKCATLAYTGLLKLINQDG